MKTKPLVRTISTQRDPNAEQVEMLAKQFGCCRYVYNRALRIDSYREGKPVYFAETCKAHVSWKRNGRNGVAV